MSLRPSNLLSPIGPVEPGMGGNQRARKIVQQIGEVPRQGRRPRDQNIVMPVAAMKGKNSRSGGPEPSFGSVSGDGIADLSASGKADADTVFHWLRGGAEFQGQAGGGTANSARGAEEIGAIFQAIHDGHWPPARLIRPKASCGRGRDGAPGPCGRQP